MLRVRVDLQPWWGSPDGTDDKVIADMTIYNAGDRLPGNYGNYVAMSHNMSTMQAKRVGSVEKHYRDQDVWHLVAKALQDMGYGQ